MCDRTVSTSPHLWIALAVSVGVALAATRALISAALRAGLLDVPNERSLHHRPTPHGGGVGILAGLVAGLAVLARWPFPGASWLAAGVLLLAVVSLLDDARPVGPLARIAVHFAVASLLVVGDMVPSGLGLPGVTWVPHPLAAAVLSVLFAVWMLNLYNFMDGMDGFAGGMTVFGFGGLAVLGALAGGDGFAASAALVASAAAGFLVFNFPPARIFMGDVGSVPLGFLAAAMILIAERDGLFPLWLGVLVFSPFVVDATITLGRRLLHGERIWQAHRSHYYQRLVQMGWSHRRTVLAEYVLMAACSASALLVAVLPEAGPAVGTCWLVGYTALAVTLSRRWACRETRPS